MLPPAVTLIAAIYVWLKGLPQWVFVLCIVLFAFLVPFIAGYFNYKKTNALSTRQGVSRKGKEPDVITYYQFRYLYDVRDPKNWWPFFEVREDGVWIDIPSEQEQINLSLKEREELFDHPNPVLRFPCTKEEFEKFTEEFMSEDMICAMREKQKPEEKSPYHGKLSVVIWGKNTTQIVGPSSKDRPMELIKWKSITVLTGYVENNKLYVSTSLYGDEGVAEVPVINNRNTMSALPWDMNFNNTALEIVDANLNPRLQLIYKNPSTVVINGLFSVPNGILLVREMMDIMIFRNLFGNWLKRLFKYPSRRFLGQEED
jgi:hypothetical protein